MSDFSADVTENFFFAVAATSLTSNRWTGKAAL
jgi:hypothetical protein